MIFPDFDWADVTGIITPETVIPMLVAGLALGFYFWRAPIRVYSPTIFSLWIIGVAFLSVLGAGRWGIGSKHWEAYIGMSVLWTLFIFTGSVAVVLWRHHLQRKETLD
jgi:hypothetical protein